MFRVSRTLLRIVAVALAVLVASGGASMASTAHANTSTSTPKHGGNITVTTEAGTPVALDPLQNGVGGDPTTMIYGGLVEPGLNGTIGWDLATSYKVADKNLVGELAIRPGVKFTDGTTLNASAVVWNWRTDLLPANACTCLSNFTDISSVSIGGPDLVDIHFTQPYGSFIDALNACDCALDWIASPTAYASEGATKFGQAPVGAGPFEVSAFVPSESLTVVRNPHYWDSPQPYLNSITYKLIGNDQSNLSAVQSGSSQIGEWVSSPANLRSVKGLGLNLDPIAPTGDFWFDIDAFAPPFNNLQAREALQYGADYPALLKGIFLGLYPSLEDLSTPADLYYEKTVPGYRTYNPTAAEAIVKSLGGLTFAIETGPSPADIQVADEFQQNYEAEGMTVTVNVATQGFAELSAAISGHHYGIVTNFGGNFYSPPIGWTTWTSCASELSSFCDPEVTTLESGALSAVRASVRAADIKELNEYAIVKEAYIQPFAVNTSYDVASKNMMDVTEAGVPQVLWQTVWEK
jgi:peptide/nickel transport system substrate-binding protein